MFNNHENIKDLAMSFETENGVSKKAAKRRNLEKSRDGERRILLKIMRDNFEYSCSLNDISSPKVQSNVLNNHISKESLSKDATDRFFLDKLNTISACAEALNKDHIFEENNNISDLEKHGINSDIVNTDLRILLNKMSDEVLYIKQEKDCSDIESSGVDPLATCSSKERIPDKNKSDVASVAAIQLLRLTSGKSRSECRCNFRKDKSQLKSYKISDGCTCFVNKDAHSKSKSKEDSSHSKTKSIKDSLHSKFKTKEHSSRSKTKSIKDSSHSTSKTKEDSAYSKSKSIKDSSHSTSKTKEDSSRSKSKLIELFESPAKTLSHKNFQCTQCHKEFASETILKSHVTDVHLKFQCHYCAKRFESQQKLDEHKVIHVKKLLCRVCDKEFISKTILKKHLQLHKESERFECNICMKKFKDSKHLKLHKATHKDKKRFQCTICKKKFEYKHVLQRHEVIHSKEKPFKCDTCGEGFTRSDRLKVHQVKAHTEIKLFCCDLCPMSSHYAHVLRRHKRNTHKVGKKKSK